MTVAGSIIGLAALKEEEEEDSSLPLIMRTVLPSQATYPIIAKTIAHNYPKQQPTIASDYKAMAACAAARKASVNDVLLNTWAFLDAASCPCESATCVLYCSASIQQLYSISRYIGNV